MRRMIQIPIAVRRQAQTNKETIMAGATKTKTKGRGERGEGRVCKNPDIVGDPKPLADALLGKKGRGKKSNAPCESKVHNSKKTPAGEIILASVQRQTWNLDWLIERIDPSPFQPRKDFPAAELRAFADEIGRDGLLQPLSVRPGGSFSTLGGDPLKSERFELVDGDRRLRAIKLLGWTQVPVRMAVYSDAEARALIIASALQRKELNAIEEAGAFQAAIDADDAAGPTELAKQLGLSQGHISNRLRLLELPKRIQKRVISREISPTNARALVPLKDAAAVLDAVLEEVKDADTPGKEMGTTEFLDAIDNAVHNTCQRIETSTTFNYQHKCNIPPLKLSDEQRKELGIITYTASWRGSKPIQYATNAKFYGKLFEAHKKAVIERAEKRAGKKAEGGTGKASGTQGREKKNGKPKPPTPAEKKRLADEERQRDKDRAAKLALSVWYTAIDWRRQLIAEACRTDQVSPEDITRLLLFLGASAACLRSGAGRGLHEVGCREKALGGVLKVKFTRGKPLLWPALETVDDQDVLSPAIEYLAKLVWCQDGGGEATIDDGDVLAIADKLAIDLAAAWKKEALGPLTKGWLDLRTKDQLAELAKSWKVDAGGGKAEMVAALLKVARRQKPPAELLKPKRPK